MRNRALLILACGSLVAGCVLGDPSEPIDTGGEGGSGSGGSGAGGNTSTGLGGSKGKGGAGGTIMGNGGTTGNGGSGGSTPTPDARLPDTGPLPDTGTPDTGMTVDPDETGDYPGCPRCVKIFDGKTLTGWHANSEKYDVIEDPILKKPVMRSTGAARGFLATDKSYQNFRLIFSNRLLGGGHAQNMLLWCQQGPNMSYPNNACGGIQYQPPKTSMWDYRPGQNKSPGGKTTLGSSGADNMDWSQCEIVAKGSTGEFKVACCKLTPGQERCKGNPVLSFKDTVSMGNLKGPVAWQAHNKGHVIHWTDVYLEENPTVDDFITTK